MPNYTISYVAGTLTVTPAALTITANSCQGLRCRLPTLTASYSGFVNGDTVRLLTTQPTLSTTATASQAVGTYPITASGAVDANYTISYVAGTLTITPAALTITASSASKVYGAGLPALSASYSGFVNGDTSGIAHDPADTLHDRHGKQRRSEPTPSPQSGAVDANYTISYVAGTLTINKDATTTAATTSTTSSPMGQAVTITATVTANSPGSGTPTGSVEFYDNTTQVELGDPTLSSGTSPR